MRWLAAVAVVVVGMVASPPAAGAQPLAGKFDGMSAQGLAFKLTVAPGRRTLTLDVRWRCAGSDPTVKMVRVHDVPVAASGELAWEGANTVQLGDGDEDRQRLRMVAHGDGEATIVGVWHADHEYFNGQSLHIDRRCASGDVPFEVRHRDGPPGTDAAGNLVTELGGEPSGLDSVAVGEGRTWALQPFGPPAVLAIDPASGALVGQAPLRDVGFPQLAVGAGAAWVLTPGGRPTRVTRIDARTLRVRRIAVPGTSAIWGYDVSGIAVGLGAVWLQRGDFVLRADPRSGRIVRRIRLTPARPPRRFRQLCSPGADVQVGGIQNGLIAVGGGAVLVVSHCGPRPARYGWLLRIDPRTNRIARAVAVRAQYRALVAGRSGVWALSERFSGTGFTNALHRISLRDGRPAPVVRLPAGLGATDLALGAGAVWVTHIGPWLAGAYTGTLLRFDPVRGRLTKTLDLEQPGSVAVGNGAAWVVDRFARTLTRVAL